MSQAGPMAWLWLIAPVVLVLGLGLLSARAWARWAAALLGVVGLLLIGGAVLMLAHGGGGGPAAVVVAGTVPVMLGVATLMVVYFVGVLVSEARSSGGSEPESEA